MRYIYLIGSEDSGRTKGSFRFLNDAEIIIKQYLPIVEIFKAEIWLYLKIAHALHGKARKLIYRSPVTGNVVIFDLSPY
ncbi:MAG: hypothetical protein AB1480_16045 [Nitrospirota bacterium]